MLRCLLRKGKVLTWESSVRVHVQIENCILFLRWKEEKAMYLAYRSSKTAGGSLHPPSPGGSQATDVNQSPRNFCLYHI